MVDFNDILARVTIADVLADAGVDAGRNGRIACPIHGGSNPTALKYGDHTFTCFNCDAKGGLIDLVQFLHSCTKQDAWRKLCDLAGIPREDERRGTDFVGKSPVMRPVANPVRRSSEYLKALDRKEWLGLKQYALEVALRIIMCNLNNGTLTLGDFYRCEEVYLYQLEELDQDLTHATHEVNSI